MRGLAGYFGWLVLIAVPQLAAAQSEGLRVVREAGSEDCPDAARLAERVEAIRGVRATELPSFAVTFSHAGSIYTAVIETDASQRRLDSTSRDCSALAQAAAVTLALLYDADANPAPSREPQPTLAEVVPQPQTSSRTVQIGLSLGAAGLIGVVRPVAPMFSAELVLLTERFRVGLGASWVPRQSLALEPGTVETEMWLGTGRACYAPVRAGRWRMETCSGVQLGAIDAAAHGFTRDETHTRSFAALPFELAIGWYGNFVGAAFAASLLVPFTRHEFGVDGAGTAYRPSAIAVSIGPTVMALLPL